MTWFLPEEPALDLANIQGHILIGFGAAPQALGAFTAKDRPAAAATIGRWAKLGRVTSAKYLLPRKGLPARKALHSGLVQGPWVMFAVSHRLLAESGAPAAFDDDWFGVTGGMPRISSLNDPAPHAGGPVGSDWVVGGPDHLIDVLMVAAAGTTDAAQDVIGMFSSDAEPWVHESFVEPLSPLRGSIEHFGFRDGISQPAIFGTVGDRPFEEERLPNTGPVPYALPGQELVWPGEFLFGYPGRGPDDFREPGPIAAPSDPQAAEFARNGSLLVYRRLAQDVPAFRAFCAEQTKRLGSDLPGLTSEDLESLVVGRRRNGVPVAATKDADPNDDATLNGFTFSGDAMAHGCPLSAHIRKVNPRLGGSDLDNNVPRLLRRGAPFGEIFNEGEKQPPERGRGLAFLAYQTSITGQFGKVSNDWMGGTTAPNGGGGNDLLVGQTEPGSRRFCELVTASGGKCVIDAGLSTWVRPTGGGFLFAPSITALKTLQKKRPSRSDR